MFIEGTIKKYLLNICMLIFINSTQQRWFVGEVYCYLIHKQNDQERVLAVLNVMKDHALKEYGVPHVVEDHDRSRIAIADVGDILKCVALIRYSNNASKCKVVWPYIRYDDPVGRRRPGAYADLRIN